MHQVIKQNFQHIQAEHPPLQNHRVISAFRKNRNLKDKLVRSAFTPQLHQTQTKHDIHYKTRKFILNPYTNVGHPILGSYSLSSSKVAYVITCTTRNRHYIGETQHTILTRFKQHLRNIGESKLTTTLVIHFQTHSVTHLIICGLEANDRWTPGQRKRTESIWIKRLGTLTPNGLNDRP